MLELHPRRRFTITAMIGILLFLMSTLAGSWVFAQDFLATHVLQLLPLLLGVIGFVLYWVGRIDFWKQAKRPKLCSIFLLLLGGFLFLYGGHISFWSLDKVEFYLLYSSPTNESAIRAGVLDLLWASLWSIASVLFFAEGLVHPQPKGAAGAMLSAAAFVIFWELTLFEAHTGGRLGRGFVSYLLGYSTYLVVSAALVLLTITGLVVFVASLRKKTR